MEAPPAPAAGTGSAPGEAVGPLLVERGRLRCLRLVDVGEEVDLDRALLACSGAPAGEAARGPGPQRPPGVFVFKHPPLDVALGPRTVALEAGPGGVAAGGDGAVAPLTVAASARVFDHGNLALRFDVPLAPGTPLAEVAALAARLSRAPALERLARDETRALLALLGGAVSRHAEVGAAPGAPDDVEGYALVLVDAFAGHPPGAEVLASEDLAWLLAGERCARPLAASERAELRRHVHAYLDDDLVAIGWDAALVLDPAGGGHDVAQVLELACVQRQAMRFYDRVLDAELTRIYDEVERAARSPVRLLLWSPYARLTRRVHRRWLGLTEMAERVEASVEVVGDAWLARVYRGALERLRVADWQQAVNRKHGLIARVYEALRAQLEARRNTLLETAIVLLIVLEIVLALLKKV